MTTSSPSSTISLRISIGSDADAACPATTSMFLRIVAEVALEEVADGAGWRTWHRAGAPSNPTAP
jgi:hypothetical protein